MIFGKIWAYGPNTLSRMVAIFTDLKARLMLNVGMQDERKRLMHWKDKTIQMGNFSDFRENAGMRTKKRMSEPSHFHRSEDQTYA